MPLSRRRFLGLSGAAAAGLALAPNLGRLNFQSYLDDDVITTRELYSQRLRDALGIRPVEFDEMPYTVDWDVFEQFSEKQYAFNRSDLGYVWAGWGASEKRAIEEKKPGFSVLDFSLANAASIIGFGMVSTGGSGAIQQWTNNPDPVRQTADSMVASLPSYWTNATADFREDVTPEDLTKIVKKAAYLYRASLVGIAPLNAETRKLGLYQEAEEVIPDDFKSVITMAIELDYDAVATGNRAAGAQAESNWGYNQMAVTMLPVALFLRYLGYEAIPHGNKGSTSIFWGIRSGLGELGRHGLLITPEYGPRVKLIKVFTDAELVPDKPIRFGVWEFCHNCNKCAEMCPPGAISYGPPAWEGPTESNEKGMYKFRIDPIECFEFWGQQGLDCSNCQAVCPYNKKRWWAHEVFRDVLGPLMGGSLGKSVDDALGYGKLKDPEEWWGVDYD